MKLFEQIEVAQQQVESDFQEHGVEYMIKNRLALIRQHENLEYGDAYSKLICACRFQYDGFCMIHVIFPSKITTAIRLLWDRFTLWLAWGE